MRKVTMLKAGVAAGSVAAALLVGSIGTAQADTVVDHPNTTASFSHSYGGMTAYIWKNTSTQAYVKVTKTDGSNGVNSRAQCERGNGGTQWYQSTIHAVNLNATSHYDCDHNGTYNRAVVGLGGDFYAS